jgi:hypothetical protein
VGEVDVRVEMCGLLIMREVRAVSALRFGYTVAALQYARVCQIVLEDAQAPRLCAWL